jgi:hypothetical protein
MRARVNGAGVLIDLIHNRDDVVRLVGVALNEGLPDIEITTGSDAPYAMTVRMPAGAFATEAVTALGRVVEATKPAPANQ